MSAVIPALTHNVYVKKVRTEGSTLDGSPVGAPDEGGFEIDFALRCLMFSCVLGASVGRAEFDFIAQDGSLPEFDRVLANYTTDDIVRVTVPPIDHEVLGKDLPDGVEEMTVFEGVFERIPFTVGSVGTRDEERVRFVGVPLPALDNVSPDHQITGRWVADNPTSPNPAPAIIESLDLQVVFNLDNKPNRSDATVSATLGENTLAGHLFTHDRDPAGSYWTAAEAIRALLVVWGFGSDSADALPRGFDLDDETRLALNSLPGGRRWEGLDTRLPEVNVHGMGVLEAIEAVCDAVGFEMAVMPHYGLQPQYDRLYVLSVGRIGGGPEAFLKLEPRGRFASSDHTETLRRNSISGLRGTRDAARIRNQVLSIGQSYIETTLQLKPLWLPAEVTTDTAAAQYAQRHVSTGEAFADYRHVGRAWGIDCLGTWAAQAGYDAEIYQHPDGGFDWVTELGLADAGSALVVDRTANGVETPIVWTRRLRNLLPLKRPEAQAVGSDYIIEFTEDGGTTWVAVPLRFTTLQEQCGLQLDVVDLAATNIASLKGGATPALAESWWGLMFPEEGDPQFAVRVTCCVPADHAAAALAPRRSLSGSVYRRQRLVRSAAEEVWSTPGSYFNSGSALQRLEGWGIEDFADRLSPLELAERERDAGETLRVAAEATTFLMDFSTWRLGERVSQLQGRNYNFDIAGDGGRHPSIAGIYVTLSGTGMNPENAQNVRIALSDNSHVGGRR